MKEPQDGRQFLSLSSMFAAPYAEIPLQELRKNYAMEIEKFEVGNYWHYTPSQILAHYHLEIDLANRLRTANAKERKILYSSLYDELFRKLPFHTQLHNKQDPESHKKQVMQSYEAIRSLLKPDSVFLEIGPGDCALSFEVAKSVKKVYAVDVSKEITESQNVPPNFELILSDGSSVDVPPESVDVAYSNQLMEHLHPEDALIQLLAIYRALRSGGVYLCITPHRFAGPADVSRFFDEEAKGFHLKEYTISELCGLFKRVGFAEVYLPRKGLGRRIRLPVWPAMALEFLMGPLPYAWKRRLYGRLNKILSIRIVAKK